MPININGINGNVGISKITTIIRIIDSMDEIMRSTILENEETLRTMKEEYDDFSYVEGDNYNIIADIISTSNNSGDEMSELVNVLIKKLMNIINLADSNKEILGNIMTLVNSQKISTLESLGRDTILNDNNLNDNNLRDNVNNLIVRSVLYENYDGGKQKKLKTRKQRNRRKQRR